MKSTITLLFLALSFAGLCQGPNWIVDAAVTVYFPYNKDKAAASELQKIQALTAEPSSFFIVTGYCDTTGTTDHNNGLSQRRADAIATVLRKRFPHEIQTVAKGEDPATPGLEQQRRVVIQRCHYAAPEPVQLPEGESKVVELGVPLPLSIQFEPGLAIELSHSLADIDFLRKTMLADPGLKVELRGHVCCENDLLLSEQRALRVLNLLSQAGVATNRMTYKGYGNTVPLVPDIHEANRIKNRRVEAVFYR